MSKLTIKQEAFVQAYLKTGNASEAYRQAYRAGKMKAETVNRNAAALLKNNKVATRLATMQAAQQKRFEISQDKWLAEYHALGFADISQAIDWGETIIRRNDAGEIIAEKQSLQIRSAKDLPPHVRAAIQSIKQTKDGGLEIKFHNKQPALDAIGKHFGWFERDNRQKGEAEAAALTAVMPDLRDLAKAFADLLGAGQEDED